MTEELLCYHLNLKLNVAVFLLGVYFSDSKLKPRYLEIDDTVNYSNVTKVLIQLVHSSFQR